MFKVVLKSLLLVTLTYTERTTWNALFLALEHRSLSNFWRLYEDGLENIEHFLFFIFSVRIRPKFMICDIKIIYNLKFSRMLIVLLPYCLFFLGTIVFHIISKNPYLLIQVAHKIEIVTFSQSQLTIVVIQTFL